MIRPFVFALDPNSAQEAALASQCGAARFVYNRMLSDIKAAADQRTAEMSYGVVTDLTPHVGVSAFEIRDRWNRVKEQVAPWWAENSKEAYATGASALATAMSNFFASAAGARKGPKVGFPRFKKKSGRKSVTFTTGVIRVEADRKHITLPRIGTVHVHESTRKLARLLEAGRAVITTATVSQHRGRWQVALVAHIDAPARPRQARRVNLTKPAPGKVAKPFRMQKLVSLVKDPRPAPVVHRAPGSRVGVDLNCQDWLVAAEPDGTEVMRVTVPELVVALENRKRRLQRLARHRTAPAKGVRPSKRWRQTQRRIDKLDWRIANIREDVLHKATTTLARTFETVAVEDLSVKGMMTFGGRYKTGLNRAIGRAAFATTRTYLTYKTAREGGHLIVVDRWFPSSKTCSACGSVKTKLPLSDRTYACTDCGLLTDRDLNAAVNLARWSSAPVVKQPRVARGSGSGASVRPDGTAVPAAVRVEAPILDIRNLPPETVTSRLVGSNAY